MKPGPEAIKLFPCSPQLIKYIILLINAKMLSITGILIHVHAFISMTNTASDGDLRQETSSFDAILIL